jgi:hypothetical protein
LAVQALGSVLVEGDRVDRLLDTVTRAGPLDGKSLLAAQLSVYRYDEGIQLLSQLVDHLDGAVKEIVHTQSG